MDKVKIIVYGLLSVLILILALFWITRKEFSYSYPSDCDFEKSLICKHSVTTCECVGIIKKYIFPGVNPKCLGFPINCNYSIYEGPMMKMN